MRACAQCGAALEPTDRFCGECGATADMGAPGSPAAPRETARAAARGPAPKASAALYVVPQGSPSALESFLRTRGEVLLVEADADAALAAVQARLARGPDVAAVCLLGADHALPMTRLEDPSGNDDAVLTDNFYGRRRSPSEAERFTGDLLPEVPVSRIPTLDPTLVMRLHDDADGLAESWRG